MAKIDTFNFGFIVVDGRQYTYDVVILPDGTVQEREAGKARLGSHTISGDDVRKVVREQPQVIVIGTGTSGMARLSRDAEDYLRQAKLNPLVLPSPEAVEKFNRLVGEGKRVAALLHITC